MKRINLPFQLSWYVEEDDFSPSETFYYQGALRLIEQPPENFVSEKEGKIMLLEVALRGTLSAVTPWVRLQVREGTNFTEIRSTFGLPSESKFFGIGEYGVKRRDFETGPEGLAEFHLFQESALLLAKNYYEEILRLEKSLLSNYLEHLNYRLGDQFTAAFAYIGSPQFVFPDDDNPLEIVLSWLASMGLKGSGQIQFGSEQDNQSKMQVSTHLEICGENTLLIDAVSEKVWPIAMRFGFNDYLRLNLARQLFKLEIQTNGDSVTLEMNPEPPGRKGPAGLVAKAFGLEFGDDRAAILKVIEDAFAEFLESRSFNFERYSGR